MAHLRQVQLPAECTGALYLHSMPGRNEPLEEIWLNLVTLGIDRIVCLAPDEELRRKSPSYSLPGSTSRLGQPRNAHRFPERAKRIFCSESDTERRSAVGLGRVVAGDHTAKPDGNSFTKQTRTQTGAPNSFVGWWLNFGDGSMGRFLSA